MLLLKFRLVDDVKRVWKAWSTQAMGASIALQSAWIAVPDDLRGRVPHNLVNGISVAILVLGFIGRFIHQPAAQVVEQQTKEEPKC